MMEPRDVLHTEAQTTGDVLQSAATDRDLSSDSQHHGVTTGAEPTLSVRPAFRRGASDIETIAASDIHDKEGVNVTPGVSHATEYDHPAILDTAGSVDETYTYPPTTLHESTLPPLEHLDESKRLRMLRMCASFLTLFLAGWNGGSTGALIPYIEKAFAINYAHVALLFVCTFIGYLVAAAGAGALARRVGFGYALCIAVIVELTGNVINSSQQKSFALMGFGFFVVGTAFATQLGLCNAYFATLPKPLMWTGLLHGIYGLGAFASPLVATAMASHGVPYHCFYLTNVGMNVPVLAMVWLAFRNLKTLPKHPSESVPESGENMTNSAISGAILKSRAVWTLSIFLLFYVGAEESIGGWIVSYTLEVRKGSPEGASWVASSFYLGIAVGRIVLPGLNMLMGERLAVFVYLLCAIGLEFMAWWIPVFASTAVCTAFVGLAISTFYTAAITTGGKLIPRNMHADAFALISSIGQSGSALWPLVVGIMSTRSGIWVVEPTVVALLGAQGICWALVPRVARRIE